MTAKKSVTWLIIITIVGSFICFYATNLLMSDLANMYYAKVTHDIVSILPLFFVSLDFILAAIAVIRTYIRPQYKKAALRLYCIILCVFSAAGIASSLYTGLYIYNSFTMPYPFPYALILTIVFHIAMLIAGAMLFNKTAKMPNDAEKRKIRPYYVFYTIFLCVLVFFTFDRFGALLWAPAFLQLRTFNITWIYYISLLLPMAVLVHLVFFMLGINKKHPKAMIVYIAIVTAADIAIAAFIFFISFKNQLFISAISPTVGLERLATAPYDTIVQFSLSFILGVYSLVYSIVQYKKIRG